ncbi:MAG: hypothetical protein IPP74_02760 [Alphaproteobacteria bacterium]|nr:hypothetical protein [Alphaproteobacteria bacterium]
MFIVLIHYIKPLAEVDIHRDAHREYIDKQIQAGTILMAGRQIPPVGGAFVARAASREFLETMVLEDPYHKAGVATFEMIEFDAGKLHPSCQHLASS